MRVHVTESPAELAIHADLGELRRASIWLEGKGRECRVPADQIQRLDHCLDEALANIIAHGGAAAKSAPVVLKLDMYRDSGTAEVALTVSDAGVPFNPVEVEPRPRPVTLWDAEPGGLGLVMVRSFADSLTYRYGESRNHLTFAVRWREA